MATNLANPHRTVVLTHTPTGVSIALTSRHHRTQREAYNKGMKYMRSRLAMLGYAPSLIKIDHTNEVADV